MFSKMPVYAETKDSAFWQAAIPAQWEVEPGLSVCAQNKRKNANLAEDQVLSLSFGRIIVKPVEHQRGLVPDSYEGYQVLDPGDIVVRPTDLQNDQTSIRVGLVRDRGIITSAYIGLRPRTPWTTGYAHAYLATVDSTKRIYGMGSGLRQQLGWTDIKRMPCLVPPAEEQAAIVKYLAHANARIDKAIAAKRRLIALLDEQSRAIANDLVTRGRGTEALRSTGIPWLPGVPANWDVAPLKRYWAVTDCKHLTVPFSDEGVPLASVSQAQRFFLDLANARRTDLESYELLIGGGRRPQRGDLIYCRNVGVGAAAVVDTDEQFAMGQDVCLMRSNGQNPVFLNHFLRSNAMRAQLELILVGSTFRRINVEDVKALTIVVPPTDAQDWLADEISRAISPAGNAVTKARQEIELLQEFRTRLVADVVTGQVDVRGIAGALPDVDATANWGDSPPHDELDSADLDDHIEAIEG